MQERVLDKSVSTILEVTAAYSLNDATDHRLACYPIMLRSSTKEPVSKV